MIKALNILSLVSFGITGVFFAIAFIFANLAIISPTGVEAYPCWQTTCYTVSKETSLTGLYVISAIIAGIIGIGLRLWKEDDEDRHLR